MERQRQEVREDVIALQQSLSRHTPHFSPLTHPHTNTHLRTHTHKHTHTPFTIRTHLCSYSNILQQPLKYFTDKENKHFIKDGIVLNMREMSCLKWRLIRMGRV
ncbi:unnamed protein product [Arctogadus glacialis]